MTEPRTPQGRTFRVLVSKVVPAKNQEYETLINDLFKLFKENKFSTPIAVSVSVAKGYQFVTNHPNLAALGEVLDEAQAIYQKKEGQELLRRAGDLTNGQDIWLARGRPDLHYVPENPSLTAAEALFTRINHLYIKSGTEDMMEAVFKKAGNLRKEHNIGRRIWIGAAITGNNLPFYILNQSGKSAADFHVEGEKITEKLGNKQQEILAELRSLLRCRGEVNDYQSRPDLSYIPEGMIR